MRYLEGVNWNQQFLGNSLAQIRDSALIFIGLILVFQFFQSYVLWRLKKASDKTTSDIDDTIIKVVEKVRPPIYITLAFFVAINTLILSGFIQSLTTVAILVLITYQAVEAAQVITHFVLQKFIDDEGETDAQSALKIIDMTIRILLWGMGILIILQNIGIDVTSLIAGLGIGGLAVALAAQQILGDLFSSFVILFDKPFKTGDFIVVGEHKGTVEKIGIKTTRIKALDGEEIVISNKELTESRIQNFKKMEERRVEFKIGVTYETPKSKLKELPKVIKESIESQKEVRFDRANLHEFGDSSLVYEIVYFLKTNDYAKYMSTQEKINLELVDRLTKLKVEFAYPTQTVILQK